MIYLISSFSIPCSGKLFSGRDYTHLFLYCESETYYEFFSQQLLGRREVRGYAVFVVGYDGAFSFDIDDFNSITKAEFSQRLQKEIHDFGEIKLRKVAERWIQEKLDNGRKSIEMHRAKEAREQQARQSAEAWLDVRFPR